MASPYPEAEVQRYMDIIDELAEWKCRAEEAIAAKERAEQRASEWEDAAAQGHPTPCTLGPLCPYCEIERLKSALALAVAECEAAHLLLTETYAFDWEFADDMPHDEAYRKARRARIATTTPESPDDSKEDA